MAIQVCKLAEPSCNNVMGAAGRPQACVSRSAVGDGRSSVGIRPAPDDLLQVNVELLEEDIWQAMAAAIATSCNRNSHCSNTLQSNAEIISSGANPAVVISSNADAILSIKGSSLPLDIANRRGTYSAAARVNGSATDSCMEGELASNQEKLLDIGYSSSRRGCSSRRRPWHSWDEDAPPHEIAARERKVTERELQVVAFSMVEGPGRTLKGRDLTNVYTHTGFHAELQSNGASFVDISIDRRRVRPPGTHIKMFNIVIRLH